MSVTRCDADEPARPDSQTVDIDLTTLAYDDLPNCAQVTVDTEARMNVEANIRVRLPGRYRKFAAAMIRKTREKSIRYVQNHADELITEGERPRDYKALSRKLASHDADSVVLNSVELRTLWGALVSWRMDYDGLKIDGRYRYVEATAIRASRAQVKLYLERGRQTARSS